MHGDRRGLVAVHAAVPQVPEDHLRQRVAGRLEICLQDTDLCTSNAALHLRSLAAKEILLVNQLDMFMPEVGVQHDQKVTLTAS